MSRTLFSTSVKSPKSFASASAASTEFWAACSKRTKNSLFLGRSDRRTGVLLWRHILRHRDRRREVPPVRARRLTPGPLARAAAPPGRLPRHSVVSRYAPESPSFLERQQSVTTRRSAPPG